VCIVSSSCETVSPISPRLRRHSAFKIGAPRVCMRGGREFPQPGSSEKELGHGFSPPWRLAATGQPALAAALAKAEPADIRWRSVDEITQRASSLI